MLVQRELIIIIYNKYAYHVAIYNFSIIPHKNVSNAKISYFITNLLENVKNVQLINHIQNREYVILAHKIVISMVKYVLYVDSTNIGIQKAFNANIVRLDSITIYQIRNVKDVLKKNQFYQMEYAILVHKIVIIMVKYVLCVVLINIGIQKAFNANIVRLDCIIIYKIEIVKDVLKKSQFY